MSAASGTTAYLPAPGDWAAADPAAAGLDPARLSAACDHARANPSLWPDSLYYPDGTYVGIREWNETGPWSSIDGPVRPKGPQAGLILSQGRIVAEWGDTARADMTFSVAKSFLALLAGIAFDDGLIPDLAQPVRASVPIPELAGAQNGAISWRHLLQQSSEWEGTLFGKSEQVDRYRQIGAGADNSRKGQARPLQAPGTFYEYNDVRVNLLALCLLHLFRRPLPEVLRERIMDPIGASAGWEWHGYSTSFVEIDGQRMQSVTGGGHWGGGFFISATDLARMGLLVARGGAWGQRRLLSETWMRLMLDPSPTLPNYGCLWWLNRGPAALPGVSPDAVNALGAGANLVWADPGRDLVAVIRWIDGAAIGGFVQRLAAASLD